ncbi:uncharacterized protein B0I36DRAFT_368136 [Microdochium trichocladiopsis]|uniref:MARVEL domain-containing protein n=1 Tax=Microdochium trichocladiopsis TaxID=1682393 RepID=A0A9P9BH42_9PEZI|nr:uncharacterized protein B0I36DRAFT_368136 [Microdochium trichocladiopsis]KAH7018089.1 hypothetical protein B0I36DRAFT_368136 [Microdochium trichocladiopsis]
MVVSKHSAEREAGREHIPQYPKGFVALRIIQLIFSLICMSLSAFALSLATSSTPMIMIFVSIFTLITTTYNIVACNIHPKLYNYWAVLTFEIFLFLAWLVAFALMGSSGAVLIASWQAYGNSLTSESADLIAVLGSVMAAAGAIGAMNWILFFVSLVMNSVLISRHRSAGLHSKRVAAGGQRDGGKVLMQSEQSYQMYPQPSGYSKVEPEHNAGPEQDVYSPHIMSPHQRQQTYYSVSSVDNMNRQGFPALVHAQSTGGSYQSSVHAQSTGDSYPSSAWVQSTPVPIYEADSQSCKPAAPMELA